MHDTLESCYGHTHAFQNAGDSTQYGRTSYRKNILPYLRKVTRHHPAGNYLSIPYMITVVVDCQSAVIMTAPEAYSLAQGPIAVHTLNRYRSRKRRSGRSARSRLGQRPRSASIPETRNEWNDATETLFEVRWGPIL